MYLPTWEKNIFFIFIENVLVSMTTIHHITSARCEILASGYSITIKVIWYQIFYGALKLYKQNVSLKPFLDISSVNLIEHLLSNSFQPYKLTTFHKSFNMIYWDDSKNRAFSIVILIIIITTIIRIFTCNTNPNKLHIVARTGK